MTTFCTIITANYYAYTIALYKSLKKNDPSVLLYVLVADGETISSNDQPGIKIVALKEITQHPFVTDLSKKYAHLNPDFFRWSLKPLWMSYLLETGFTKVFFVDCDIFFFDDHSFLFDLLDGADILLTRQWYASDPATNESSFGYLLTNGAFNAGFVGSNKNGLPALHWWANACYYQMGVFPEKGIYDDQRYLDLFPILFNGIKILEHKGCNLGSGNHEECPRIMKNGKVLIDGKFPVIFIHFYTPLIKEILMGYDPLLLPYYQEYKRVLEEYGISLEKSTDGLKKYFHPSFFSKVKWRLRPRTRLKSFLHKLATKL